MWSKLAILRFSTMIELVANQMWTPTPHQKKKGKKIAQFTNLSTFSVCEV